MVPLMWVSMVRLCWCRASLSRLARVPATSTPALLLRVDDTKEDKHSDVQLDLLSISRLFFSRFSILNVGSVLSKSFWFDSADSFLFLDGSVFDWKAVRVLMVVGL